MSARRKRSIRLSIWSLCGLLSSIVVWDHTAAQCQTAPPAITIEDIAMTRDGQVVDVFHGVGYYDSRIHDGIQLHFRGWSPCTDGGSWDRGVTAPEIDGLGPDEDGSAGFFGCSGTLHYTYIAPLVEVGPHTVRLVSHPGGYGNYDCRPVRVVSEPVTIWVVDGNGNSGIEPPACQAPETPKPVNLASGKMYHEMSDLTIQGPLPIEFVRRFDSLEADRSSSQVGVDWHSMGSGWLHSYQAHLEFTSPQFTTFVSAKMRRVPFNCQLFDIPSWQCLGAWRDSFIDHYSLSQGTNPPWQVADKDRNRWDFDQSGQLIKIWDRNDNWIAVSNVGAVTTITDEFGRGLTVTTNDTGLVDHVAAGDRTVRYVYDCDELGYCYTTPLEVWESDSNTSDHKIVTYTYEPPPYKMTTATDANGHLIESHEYTNGRVTHTQSAGDNNSYQITYVGNPATETIVTNGRGASTIYTIDPRTGVATDRMGGPGCSSCGGGGSRTQKSYDAHLNLTDVVDGQGVRTHMTYDDRGNTLTRTENCSFDENGNCVPSATSRTTVYSYDSVGRLHTISAPTLGSGACATARANKVTTLDRDAHGNVLTETTIGCNGTETVTQATAYTYDPHGRVLTVTDPRLNVSTYAYYPDTQPSPPAEPIPENNLGRLQSVTNALNQPPTIYADYDYFGNAGSITDPNGVKTTYTFDFKDHVLEHRIRLDAENPSDESDLVTRYEYDAVGNLYRVRLPNCFETQGCDFSYEYEYDAVNRLKEIHDAVGNKIVYTYDSEGNALREEYQDASAALKRFTRFAYDDFNRLKYSWFQEDVMPPDGIGVTFYENSYYDDGTQETETDPLGHMKAFAYDDLKRLKTVTETVGTETLTTTYDYDAHGGLIKVTDPRGLETTYVNDDLGWRRSMESPDTGTTTYDYDPAGNLTGTTDANRVSVSRAYDALNRLTTTTYPDSSLNVTYEYDSLDVPFGIGRRTGMVDPSGTTLYSYDLRGLLTSEDKEIDGLTFSTGYDYDKNGNLLELRYPSIDPTTRQGAVDYHYDAADRIDEVSVLYDGDPIPLAINIEYKPFGPRMNMTLGNSLLDARTFDTRYQLGTWNLTNAVPESLLSYTHSFNADGNLGAITDNLVPSPGNNRSFGYDEIHRLTSAVGPWGPGTSCSGQTYTYDKNGNRTCKNESGTATTSYEYPSNSNRLASLNNGAVPISYDANGNTKSDGTHTYDYSDANRLAMVDGGGTLYDYDGENRRARKSNAQTTYFFYDQSGRILTEMIHNAEAYGGGNGFGQDYVYLPDAPIARVDWSVVNNPNYHQCSPSRGGICPPPRIAIADLLYYHTDHLGTPLAMTNQSGELVWKAESLPFGDLFSNTISTVGNNLRFLGQYFDTETRLHQNWFRDYQPKTGRYQEADPIGLDDGTNPYSYVVNDPTGLKDPTGLTYRSNWEYFRHWISGGGNGIRPYGSSDLESRELSDSPGGRMLRDNFYAGGCKSFNGGTFGTPEAYFYTLIYPPTADWGSTAAEVGGFAGATATVNDDGTVTFRVLNDSGTHSFFLHIPRDRKSPNGLGRTIHQSFEWTEPIYKSRCGCENK